MIINSFYPIKKIFLYHIIFSYITFLATSYYIFFKISFFIINSVNSIINKISIIIVIYFSPIWWNSTIKTILFNYFLNKILSILNTIFFFFATLLYVEYKLLKADSPGFLLIDSLNKHPHDLVFPVVNE